eukprot:scaffold81795_cov33-Phaeocystis_antarctica.AAC.1
MKQTSAHLYPQRPAAALEEWLGVGLPSGSTLWEWVVRQNYIGPASSRPQNWRASPAPACHQNGPNVLPACTSWLLARQHPSKDLAFPHHARAKSRDQMKSASTRPVPVEANRVAIRCFQLATAAAGAATSDAAGDAAAGAAAGAAIGAAATGAAADASGG